MDFLRVSGGSRDQGDKDRAGTPISVCLPLGRVSRWELHEKRPERELKFLTERLLPI